MRRFGNALNKNKFGEFTMYERFGKRVLDFLLASVLSVVLSPVLVVLTVTGLVAMGGNPFFTQPRPGRIGSDGKERIFLLAKFRTMSNKKDKDGNLLPDKDRLNAYGKFLRSTSLDELPEFWNILRGELSFVGPRPQLVRDMVFMTQSQRRRHSVTPGLTGYAQVSGRNNITWEQKFQYDLQYIDRGITFLGDLKIVFATIGKVLKRSDTVRQGTASDLDFGDYLLQSGQITQEEYDEKQAQAKTLLRK